MESKRRKSREERANAGGGGEARVWRRVMASWRELTGAPKTRDAQRRTLLAVSGGCDSSAMAIALARGLGAKRAGQLVVLGHVVHDLRSSADREADQDRVRELGERLGVACVERAVRVPRGLGRNVEAEARRVRYAALAEMAAEAGCSFVATAHQADDVLETVLMRLLRGTGVRGLAAIHPVRRLTDAVALVRPMLVVDRAACERVCAAEGWAWCEDPTNQDEAMLRNAVRAKVTPVLRTLAPRVAERAVSLSHAAREAQDVVRACAADVRVWREGEELRWDRNELRSLARAVVHDVLVCGMRHWRRRVSRRDGAGAVQLRAALRAIRDAREDRRNFELGRGLVLRVDAVSVRLRVDPSAQA